MRKLITCPAMSRSNSSPDTAVPMVGLVIGAHAAIMVSSNAIQRTRPHPCCRFPSRILGPNAAARKSALRAGVEAVSGSSGLQDGNGPPLRISRAGAARVLLECIRRCHNDSSFRALWLNPDLGNWRKEYIVGDSGLPDIVYVNINEAPP